MKTEDYRHYILRHYQSKRDLDAKYSMRAFAKDLNLSPSTLSEILNRHHTLSLKSSEKVLAKLEVSAEEAMHFRYLICEELFKRKTSQFITQSEKDYRLTISPEKENSIVADMEQFFEQMLESYYNKQSEATVPLYSLVSECLSSVLMRKFPQSIDQRPHALPTDG